MKKLKMFAPLLLSLAVMGTAQAQSAAISPNTAVSIPGAYNGILPTVLEGLKAAGGLKVIKDFPAAGGLNGWVIQDGSSGKFVVVYTTPDGTVMFAGLALDKDGQNLSAVYSEQHIPAADYSVAFNDFTNVADKVTVGAEDAPAELTVAFDSNCAYCKSFHKLITPAVEAGELRVHYVPVAILGGDSPQKGAGLLAATDLKSALHADVYGGSSQKSSDAALLAKVQANTDLMRKNGFNGTPLVLYKGKKDGDDAIFVSNGVPNIGEMFTKLGISGQIDKLRADPSIARFLP